MRASLGAAIGALALAGATLAGQHGVPATVLEAWVSPARPGAELDSPAFWSDGRGRSWVIATGKADHRLHVFEAATGRPVTVVGGAGAGPGRFRRPNGIAVHGDLLFVVERDNRRLQVLSLPDLRPLGFVGEGALHQPYGLALVPVDEAEVRVYVTDLLEGRAVGEPVKELRVRVREGRTEWRLVRAFGRGTDGGGPRKVESILADPALDRLYVADEAALDLKVYSLDGEPRGLAGGDLLRFEPEGLALRPCGAGGWLVVTDQHARHNTFHLLDRTTLRPVASFRGRLTAGTDGIALATVPVGEMRAGSLFALHDDRSVSALSWEEIGRSTGLPPCGEGR